MPGAGTAISGTTTCNGEEARARKSRVDQMQRRWRGNRKGDTDRADYIDFFFSGDAQNAEFLRSL